MLACRDVAELISRSMDTSIPIGKWIGVRVHLLMCKFCARYERQLLLVRETLRRLVAEEHRHEGPAGETLSEVERERIKKSLRNP